MKVWNVLCRDCGYKLIDQLFSNFDSPNPSCSKCGGVMDKTFEMRTAGAPTAWHRSERVVVYRDPRTGDIKYPGRNDTPMPDRYRQQGYERVEMGDLATVTKFEKSEGVTCQAMHYDSNGKVDRLDPEPETPKVQYSDLLA